MKLTRQQYYAALGLLHLARSKYAETRKFELALCEMIGVEDDSHISDAVYSNDDSLDAALKRQGIEVEPEAPQ